MSVNVQEFLNNAKLPRFIVDNDVLKSFTKIDKAFPRLGLPNFQETCLFDNSELAKQSAWLLLDGLHSILNSQRSYLDQKCYGERYSPDKVGKIRGWYNILDTIIYQIDCGYNHIIHLANGKTTLKLLKDINEDFKGGESLFRVYNKVYDGIRALRIGSRMAKLDTIQTFKDFSSENIPNRNYNIVFSSDGLDGLWDIATMSMRGIKSCQSWTSSSKYKTNIIGSLVDPFVGVIYLTTGKNTDLGSKMLKRCVVRIIVDKQTRKPSIAIDRMYPDYDTNVAELFLNTIRQRLDNKIDVAFAPSIRYEKLLNMYVPHSKVHNKLTKTTKSYMDTKLTIGKSQTVVLNKQKPVLQSIFNNEICCNIGFWDIAHKYNPANISKSTTIQASIQKILIGADFRYLLKDYYQNVFNDIVATIPSNTLSSKDYTKRIYYQFLTHKPDKRLMTTFVRATNTYYNLPKNGRITGNIMDKLLTQISVYAELSKAVKSHLRAALDASSDKTNIVSMP